MPTSGFDTDRNLLFAVLALQADLLDITRFAEICTAWSTRKDTALADLLIERGWLTGEQKAHIEFLLDCKLKKHGDAQASLAAVANDSVQRVLSLLGDPDLQRSLAMSTAQADSMLPSSLVYEPNQRERYTLTRLHAQGGLGRVWLARDSDLGREVALKELRPEGAKHPALWARFVEEARITGQLEHRGIVPVYELGRRTDDQQPFYTMRFVHGRTLRDAIADYHGKRQKGEATALDFNVLLHAFVSVCQAVAYAHSRRVLHRDLKPQNVVLGDYGEVLVLDWGLAKLVRGSAETDGGAAVVLPGAASHDLTLQGAVLGTPAYMAPEQATGRLEALDCRTDVYGLGAILYEILTGQPPFTGNDTQQVLRKVSTEAPPLPKQRVTAVPPALQAICLKGLRKQPSRRYGSPAEMAAEVQRFLADEPVLAYREPLLSRLGRWARRHRPLVAGAGALLLTAVVALALGLLAVNTERARTKQALQGERRALAAETQRRQQARDALDAMTSEVMDDLLPRQAVLSEPQKKFLERALTQYEEFARDTGDDETARAGVAGAYLRVANILTSLGRRHRAATAYRASQVRFAQLAADFPAVFLHRLHLAVAHHNLGNVYLADGQVDQAAAEYSTAASVGEQLAADFPDNPAARQSQVNALLGLGNVLGSMGRLPEAIVEHKKVLAIDTELAHRYPASPDYRHGMALSHNNIGVCLGMLGHLDEEAVELRQALALDQQLVKQFPHITLYRRELAGHHGNLAVVLATGRHFHDAEVEYRSALAIQQPLASEFPSVPAYRSELAGTYMNLGNLRLGMEDTKGAEVAYERALALYRQLAIEVKDDPGYENGIAATLDNLALVLQAQHDLAAARSRWLEAAPHHLAALKSNPRQPEYRRAYLNHLQGFARVLNQQGDHGEATLNADRLGALGGENAVDLYNAACLMSNCVPLAQKDARLGRTKRQQLAIQYADRAMAWLRKAVDHGFKDVAHMKKDTDLDPLRSRADFKNLLNAVSRRDRGTKTSVPPDGH